MSQTASSNPSNHQSTANALQYRGLKYISSNQLKSPRNLHVICDDFRQVVDEACQRRMVTTTSHAAVPAMSTRATSTNEPTDPVDVEPFSSTKIQMLQAAMTDEHKNEVAFDIALFNALRGCLTDYQLAGGDNQIVLQSHGSNNDMYAVGFVRQAEPGRKLTKTKKEDSVRATSSTSSGLQAKSQSDHAVCLFESVGNKWKVKDYFCIIELKTNETNCEEFPIINNKVKSPVLASRHGALGQELLYTIGSIVLYHARNGIWKKNIPMAVIAGRKQATHTDQTKRQKTTDRLRWVWSVLNCPEVSGDPFTFSVDGFGKFHDRGTPSDTESADEAVRLFLDTMLFGLKLAIGVRDMRNGGTIPQPCPASGSLVFVGKQKLGVSLCASPIKDAATIANDSHGQPWTIHQADLFRGNVNLNEILEQPGLDLVDFRSEQLKEKPGETTVLVKVSSTAVYSLLIHPINTMIALKLVREGTPKMVEEIGSVLYAVYQPEDVGLITVMSDLSADYKALTPAVYSDRYLPALWAGFATLVKDVLLPMAEKRVIHPDIRPGYDVTSNILCKLSNDGANTTAELKLIDLESLVLFRSWIEPMTKDGPDLRFLPARTGWDATTFVWWQCVFVFYVWKEKIKELDVVGEDDDSSVIAVLDRVLVNQTSDGPAWLVELRPYTAAGTMDAASVISTLMKLGELL